MAEGRNTEMYALADMSSAVNHAIESLHSNELEVRVTQRFQNSHLTEYYLNEEQCQLLSRYLGRNIRFENSQNLKRSTHPIASALNEFARKEVEHNFGNVEILNIGGNSEKEIGAHFCNKITDCRNDVRLKGKTCCVNGVENCSYKPTSKIAVSVDSFYDIPIELIPYIMKRHDLDVIHCYMYLPYELLNKDLIGLKKSEYNISIVNDNVYFSFKDDLAPSYAHNLHNWLKYFKTTLITSKIFGVDCNVFIEFIRSYGPFHHLTFTLTSFNNPTPRIYNFSNLYSDFLLLPDYHHVMCKQFCIKFKDVPKIPLKKLLFDRVYTYVTSGDDSTFNFNRCATFFRGITSKITIGQTVLVEQTELFGHSYDLVLFNIYICAIISRLRRSKDLGNFITHIDNDYSSCDDFKTNPHHGMFSRFIVKIKLWWQEKAYGGNRIQHLNDPDSEDFMTFDVEKFDDIIANQVIDLNAGLTIDKSKHNNKLIPFNIKPHIKKFLTTLFNYKLPILKQTTNLYVILDYLETVSTIFSVSYKASQLHGHSFDNVLLNSIAKLYNFDFVMCKENNLIYNNFIDLNVLQSLFVEYDIKYDYDSLKEYRQNSLMLPKTMAMKQSRSNFLSIGVKFDGSNFAYDKIICDYVFYPYNLHKYHQILSKNFEEFLLSLEPSEILISQSVFLDNFDFYKSFESLLSKFCLKHHIVISNFRFTPFIYTAPSTVTTLDTIDNNFVPPKQANYHNKYLSDYKMTNVRQDNNLTYDFETNILTVNASVVKFNDIIEHDVTLRIGFHQKNGKVMSSCFTFVNNSGQNFVFDFDELSIDDNTAEFADILITIMNASYFNKFNVVFDLGGINIEAKYCKYLVNAFMFTIGPVNFTDINMKVSPDFIRVFRKLIMINCYNMKNFVVLNEPKSLKKFKPNMIDIPTIDNESVKTDHSFLDKLKSKKQDACLNIDPGHISKPTYKIMEITDFDLEVADVVNNLVNTVVNELENTGPRSPSVSTCFFTDVASLTSFESSLCSGVDFDELTVITPLPCVDAVSREPSIQSSSTSELRFGDIDIKDICRVKPLVDEVVNLPVDTNFENKPVKIEDNKLEVNDATSIKTVKSDILEKRLIQADDFPAISKNTAIELAACVNAMNLDEDSYSRASRYERRFLKKARSFHKFDYMISKTGQKRNVALDIGCAPGHLSQLGYKEIHGYHYIGEGALKLKFSSKYTTVTEFNDLSVCLIPDIDYDHVLIDIGNEEHTVDCYNSYFRFCNNNVKLLIFKCYLEQAHLIDLEKINNFEKVSIVKPAFSFSLNREFYFICQNFNDSKEFKHDIGYQFECIAQSVIKAHKSYLSKCVPIELNIEPDVKEEYTKVTFNVDKEMFNNFTGDLMMQLNRCDNKELRKVVGECSKVVNMTLEKLKKSKQSEVKVECNIHNAPAGSRKSNLIISKATNFDFIVVPTRELKYKYDNRSPAMCYTYHNALIKIKDVKTNIYIDECFMFLKSYYAILRLNNPDANLYLLGDSNQIGVVPFNLKFLDHYKLDCDKYNAVTSYRCPMDVPCYNKQYQFNTSNKKIFSVVTTNIVDFSNNKNFEGIHIICYKQSSKNTLSKAFPKSRVNTIHEFQGGECDHVAWVLDVDEFSNIPQKHYNVAMTRHNNTLIVVTNEPNKFDLNYLNTLFDNINELHDRPLRSYISNPPEDRVVIKECEDRSFFDKMKINHADLTTIFSKVNNLTSNENQYKNLSTTKFNEIKQGKLILSDTVFAENNTGKKGKYLTDINTAKNYNAKDKLAAVKTLIDRYTMATKDFTEKEIIDYLPYLKRGLNKFLKYEYGSQNFKNRMKITEQQWFDNVVDYLKSVHKKGTYPEGYDTDFDDESLRNKIKFFMKAQDKHPGLNFDFAQSDKAGQGVSAWDKMLNAIYCGFVRCFSQNLRSVLKDNVVYANGKSDAAIGADIANNMREIKQSKRYITIENDISQFDTGQSKLTVALECEIMAMMGLSEVYIGLYREHRASWSLSFTKFATLFGKGKKHSGEPFTIDFNSLLCLCINGLLFEVYTYEVAAFKGDDFYMVTDFVQLDQEKAEFIEKIGFKTKVYEGVIGEFTGYIVTPYGYYPDLLRVTQKFLNKCIVDEKYFEELKLAMKDRLQTIATNKWARLEGRWFYLTYINKKINEAGFGKESLMNYSDVEIMESFMFNVHNWKYQDLFQLIKPNLILNSN